MTDPLELAVARQEMLRLQAKALIDEPDQPFRVSEKRQIATVSTTSPARLILHLLRERDGTSCYLCGRDTTVAESCVEHVIPRSRGGTNEPSNVRVACVECNREKADRYVSLTLDRRPMYHYPRWG